MSTDNRPTETAKVIQFRRAPSYEAKLQVFLADGLEFHVAGTLDGYIDFAVVTSDGASLTYSLSCDGSRQIIAALHLVIDDIQANCLFDRDPLLVG
jgi:hypothetical protein